MYGMRNFCTSRTHLTIRFSRKNQLKRTGTAIIKTHDSESRGQEEAGRTRDEQVSYLHVAPL